MLATKISEFQLNLQAFQGKHVLLCQSLPGTKISRTEADTRVLKKPDDIIFTVVGFNIQV